MSFLDPKPQTQAGLDSAVAAKINTPGSDTAGALKATYVTFRDSATGLPITGKRVTMTINQALNEIVDIIVEAI